ncbi:haloacid dehalogenase type II [Noviherbaspirillum pedocola]|uniref:(S)-2-haloacid dehalogenase n=1 Tax=Noviherbaspirillum pedocola TaxID=2801341 RepID=A0A934SM58_9BURK|nr:haloacid dehalogenase type II [Noviherbaspirillum pedocola]MBK4733020.1 haloacid dehalogenase type II [Noviherbaspirillum pedocola]
MVEQKLRPTVLLFDVNETLLDLTPLSESINAVLLDERAAKLWFTTMLQYSLVMTASEQHASLPDIGAAVLEMMAKNTDVVLTTEQAKKALEPMRTLPAFPDVRPGLEQLKQKGFRLATLTNSSQSGVKAQIDYAGLSDCFERQLSVESVGKYKPHRSVYEWAVKEMGCEPGQCMLVAAHGWDVAGAKWAGLQTAFVARAGQQLFPLGPKPDFNVADIQVLADQLCKGN